MSEDPIRMKYCGLGNAIPRHYCAHYEEKAGCIIYRNPMKDGALAKEGGDGGKVPPYVATLRDGVNDNVTIPTKESDPILYCALDAFFGKDISWRDGCYDLPIGCNRGLICKPQVGYMTLLRGDNPMYRPLQYWKSKDGKPVLSLMTGRCFGSVSIPESAWVFSTELCLLPVVDCLCAMSTHALSVYITPTSGLHRFERPYWTEMGEDYAQIFGLYVPWLHRHPEEVVLEDETTTPPTVRYLLPEGLIKDADGNLISANGVSDTYYATLGQTYIKHPTETNVEKDGVYYCSGIPVRGMLTCVEQYCMKPYAFYVGQDFTTVRAAMDAMRVKTSTSGYGSLVEKLVWPGISNRTMPGVYRDENGRIAKIVGGHYCSSYSEARTLKFDAFYDDELLVGSHGGEFNYYFNADFMEASSGDSSSWEDIGNSHEFLVRIIVYTSGNAQIPEEDAREITFPLEVNSVDVTNEATVEAAPGTPSGVVKSIVIDKVSQNSSLVRVTIDGVQCANKGVRFVDFIVKLNGSSFNVSDPSAGSYLTWEPFSNEANDYYNYLHPVYV